ncbi:hypothetical protein PybrP1_003083 [[Pythium] brassicae (nom. inval.)]|nr:hypothetical protein PybrP1_003083 [[Pythium] brassicae (nom. inval.)]
MERTTYGSKHEGLRMSSPPARTCDASSPRRRLLPPAELPLLFARPASVHFGGFALRQRYEQRVLVTNNNTKPVRLRFVLPSKGFAHVTFARERRPLLPAGLSEELVVAFTPIAFQYHYDCIQVRAEEVAYASNTDTVLLGSCVVPIHAYPVLNDVRFPTRMDFGAVPRGGVGRRHFDLTCSVPIEFEYELELAKAHPSFTVFPLKGMIPAHGAARIEFEFRPLVFATASAEVVLHVSQFGFSPMTCALVGSSSPGDALSTAPVSAVVSEAEESASPSIHATHERAKTPAQSPTKASQAPREGRRQTQSPSGHNRSSATPDMMEQAGGLEIPADLSSMASVNFVLTQQPGKLKPKDLKKAVEASRALRKRQKDEQAKFRAPSGADEDPTAPDSSNQLERLALTFPVLVREEENFLQRADVSRQIKELFFTQEVSDAERLERELEYQSHRVRLGDELLSAPELEFLQQMRALNALAHARRQRETQRNCFSAEEFSAQSQPTRETPEPPRGALPAHFVSAYAPDFKAYKNDLWARRQRVVQRFVRAVSTCIVRLRAQQRLERVKRWLGSSRTRAQVRERVALDWQRQSLGGGGGSVSNTATSSLVQTRDARAAQSLFFESFPLVEEKTHTPREFIAQPADWSLKFDALAFLPLREQNEAQLSGHEPLELPPLPTYVPLESGRALRVGAADECGGPRHLLEEQDAAALVPPRRDTTAPSLLQQTAPDVFLRPSASVRPLVRIQNPRETDPSFVLRPQRVFRTPPTTFGAVQEQSVGLRSLTALKGSALELQSVYLPPTERPRAQPLLWPLTPPMEGETGPVYENQELFRDVWFISQRPSSGIPSLATGADEVPCLSDSESDGDDSEGQRHKCPTWEDAVQLFESDADNRSEPLKAEALGCLEAGELLGRANGVYSFERYRQLIRLERAYNDKREALLQLLPSRLREVAKGISHPDYELVVEGHGSERPLHGQQRAA